MTAREPQAPSQAVANVMRANRKVDSRPEVMLRSALQKAGLRFRKNRTLLAGGVRAQVDVVFPRQRVAVFMDGCFWHGCAKHGNEPRANVGYWVPKLERNRRRDTLVSAALTADGWRVVRVWEHVPPNDAALAIARLVRAPVIGNQLTRVE